MSESDIKQPEQDGRTDFDFFIGSWKIWNKNLPERLKGSTTWEEFGGTSVARKILGGLGHIEEFTMERAPLVKVGITLRLFDPKTQQWRSYAAYNGNGLDPKPVIGAFNKAGTRPPESAKSANAPFAAPASCRHIAGERKPSRVQKQSMEEKNNATTMAARQGTAAGPRQTRAGGLIRWGRFWRAIFRAPWNARHAV